MFLSKLISGMVKACFTFRWREQTCLLIHGVSTRNLDWLDCGTWHVDAWCTPLLGY